MSEPIHTDRESARAKLVAKIETERRLMADPRGFSTTPPQHIIDHAEWCLRWIDCAPDGANHTIAPMQDKRGVPMGTAWDENVGPCHALRDARIARGLNPFSGECQDDVTPGGNPPVSLVPPGEDSGVAARGW